MGYREEVELLSALAVNKDIHVLFEGSADHVITDCSDIWGWVKDYYEISRQVPSGNMLEKNFPNDFDFVQTDGPTVYYMNQLRSKFVDEKLRQHLSSAASSLKDGDTAGSINTLNKGINELTRVSSSVRDINVTDTEDAVAYFESIKKYMNMGSVGVKTNISQFDVCLPMGISKGQLGILLAYPAIGKSWLALKMAVEAWKTGKTPLILSLEMTEQEVRNRILAIIGEGKWSHRDLSSGRVDVNEFRDWANDKMKNMPAFRIISGDEGGDAVTPSLIKAKINQYKPDIVFVDYMQLMSDNSKTSSSETIKIKNLSRELKLLAISEHVPIVAIASATPDDATDLESVPQLGQVAWSKSIAYDSDWVVAMGRSRDSNILEVAFRKNRNGHMGDFYLELDFDKGGFREVWDDEV